MVKKGLFICLLGLLFSCSDENTPTIEQSLEINIPLNKTSIHATAYYQETKSDLLLSSLQISRIQFNEEFFSTDTLFMRGTIEEYTPDTYQGSGIETSDITLSFTDNWISIQKADANINLSLFFKNGADTTQIPALDFLQFPLLPRILKANTTYEIIRPETEDLIPVYRKFRVDEEKRWDDPYGFQTGFFVETTMHFFDQDNFSYNSIVDESGIVISQTSRQLIITPGNPDQSADTLYIHTLNRRIEDYSDDFQLRDLDYYVNQIQNTPIPLIYRFFE